MNTCPLYKPCYWAGSMGAMDRRLVLFPRNRPLWSWRTSLICTDIWVALGVWGLMWPW